MEEESKDTETPTLLSTDSSKNAPKADTSESSGSPLRANSIVGRRVIRTKKANTLVRNKTIIKKRKKKVVLLNADTAMEIVKHLTHKYRCVGWHLFIPDSVVDELHTQHSSDLERLGAAVIYWLTRDPLISWRRLNFHLSNLTDCDLLSEAELEKLTDPSLNAWNVLAVLEAVNNVDEEWKILQLSSSKWKELNQPDVDDSQCRAALVEYYLKTSPYASWEHIAGRCLYYGKDLALESAKGWIRLTKDPTLTASHLSELLYDVNWKWSSLSDCLDIPVAVSGTISQEHPDDNEAEARACCDWYLDNHPAPSWEHAAIALYESHEHDTLANLWEHIPSLKESRWLVDNRKAIVEGSERFGFKTKKSSQGLVVNQIMDHTRCPELAQGDILWEVNDEDVLDYSSSMLNDLLNSTKTASFRVIRAPPNMLSLEVAIKQGNTAEVSTILEQASNLNINECVYKSSKKLTGNFSALMIASEVGQTDIVDSLMKCDIITVDQKNHNGMSALMVACLFGHTSTALCLLESADADLQSKDGWSALMFASKEGHLAVVQALLDKKASIDLQNHKKWSALMIASEGNHIQIVQALLQKGAQVNLQNSDRGFALKIASRLGNYETVEQLLDGGADVDLQNSKGCTALMSASKQGHSKVVKILLKKQSSIDIQDDEGYTALMNASEEGHSTVTKHLLQSGADVDLQSPTGDCALSLATINKHSEVVNQIVSAKKDEDEDLDLGEIIEEVSFPSDTIPLTWNSLNLIKWKDQKGNTRNFHLVSCTSKKWHRIGRMLNYSMEELRSVQREHNGSEELCWCHLMEKWMLDNDVPSYPATWKGLYDLLKDSEVPESTLKLFQMAVTQAVPPHTSSSKASTHSTQKKTPERPVHNRTKQIILYRDKRPSARPKKGTKEFGLLAEFCENVQFIIQAVNDNEYQAAVTQMEPPETFPRTVVFPRPGNVIGLFTDKKVALIHTGEGSDCSDYVLDAIQTFPNARFIIGLGVCYAFDSKKNKLGDVLVSKQICDMRNLKFGPNNELIDRGQRVNVVKDLREIFCMDLVHEEDFEVACDPKRFSNVSAGQFASLPAIVENKEMCDKIRLAMPEAIGGDTEGGELLKFQSKGQIEGVVVIKGVSHYADKRGEDEWEFSASLAAVVYTKSKLNYYEVCDHQRQSVSRPRLSTEDSCVMTSIPISSYSANDNNKELKALTEVDTFSPVFVDEQELQADRAPQSSKDCIIEEESSINTPPTSPGAEEKSVEIITPPHLEAEKESVKIDTPPSLDAEEKSEEIITPTSLEAEEKSEEIITPTSLEADEKSVQIITPTSLEEDENQSLKVCTPPLPSPVAVENTVSDSPLPSLSEDHITEKNSPCLSPAAENHSVEGSTPSSPAKGKTLGGCNTEDHPLRSPLDTSFDKECKTEATPLTNPPIVCPLEVLDEKEETLTSQPYPSQTQDRGLKKRSRYKSGFCLSCFSSN